MLKNNGFVLDLMRCDPVVAMRDMMQAIQSGLGGVHKIVSADIDELAKLIAGRDRRKM